MLEVILARHGETAWNAAELFRGRADIELNETGRKQAGLLGEYLSNVKLDAVYSSPLKRAVETARVVSVIQSKEVIITPGLIDFDYGEWQGLSHQEVKSRYRELYEEWTNRPEQVRMPAGESLDDVRKRAVTVVDEVAKRRDGGKVLLVSHRVVNKVLICALLGLDNSHFWNIKLNTCGLTSFDYEDNKFILTRHNDTSFLRSVERASLADF